MAHKTNSYVLPLISVFLVLLALAGEANAGRNVPTNPSKDEKKEPEWLIGHDGSFLIPGIGRVMVPPLHTVSPYAPFPGTGSPSTGSGSHNYIPGGDDTFVPNPGYEVPTPGRTAPANTTP